jgi:hypothetical protein
MGNHDEFHHPPPPQVIKEKLLTQFLDSTNCLIMINMGKHDEVHHSPPPQVAQAQHTFLGKEGTHSVPLQNRAFPAPA